jgi:hypothetical protein
MWIRPGRYLIVNDVAGKAGAVWVVVAVDQAGQVDHR